MSGSLVISATFGLEGDSILAYSPGSALRRKHGFSTIHKGEENTRGHSCLALHGVE